MASLKDRTLFITEAGHAIALRTAADAARIVIAAEITAAGGRVEEFRPRGITGNML
ncbi:hypothetical protein [Streptomyces sp. NPDC086777]|uniref:hypothetical protein n=1 Tax=Streptomyces sp. NPDC086777 TaxID=3154866 RepID=UPI00344D0BFE